MNALLLAVPSNQSVKYGQDMPAVFDHAGENIAEIRLAFGFAMPFGQDGRGNFDVSAELLRGVPTKEKAIKKGRFALGKVEIQRDFGGNELCHCGHGEKAVYRKAPRRQVVPGSGCYVAGNPSRETKC